MLLALFLSLCSGAIYPINYKGVGTKEGLKEYGLQGRAAFTNWVMQYQGFPGFWDSNYVSLQDIIISAKSESEAPIAKLDRAALVYFLRFVVQAVRYEPQDFSSLSQIILPPTPSHSPSQISFHRYLQLADLFSKYPTMLLEGIPDLEKAVSETYRQLTLAAVRLSKGATPDYQMVHKLFELLPEFEKVKRLVRQTLSLHVEASGFVCPIPSLKQMTMDAQVYTAIALVDVCSNSMKTFTEDTRKFITTGLYMDKTSVAVDPASLNKKLLSLRLPVDIYFAQYVLAGKLFSSAANLLHDDSGVFGGLTEGLLLQYIREFLLTLHLTENEESDDITTYLALFIQPDEGQLKDFERLVRDLVACLETMKDSTEEKLKKLQDLSIGQGRMFEAKVPNHAMLVFITRDGDDQFTAELFNSGDGLQHHDHFMVNQSNHPDQSTEKHCYVKTVAGLTFENLKSLNMFAWHDTIESFYARFKSLGKQMPGSPRFVTKSQKGGSCVLSRWFMRAHHLAASQGHSSKLLKAFRFAMEVKILRGFIRTRFGKATSHLERMGLIMLISEWSDSKVKKILAMPEVAHLTRFMVITTHQVLLEFELFIGDGFFKKAREVLMSLRWCKDDDQE